MNIIATSRFLLPMLTLLWGAMAAAQERPLSTLPYTPSLEPAFMDRSVDPCVDLYRYSCGGWIKKNPIPADQSRWSVYGKVQVENQQLLWGIAEEAARQGANRSPSQQKIGDYFAACMDETAIEKTAATPLQPILNSIDKLTSKADLARFLASVHMRLFGGSSEPAFGFSADQDPSNSDQIIAFVGASGLGLPDRDYYTKSDPKSVEIRQRYVEHIAIMLGLLGTSAAQAKTDAAAVMRIETALAKGSLTRVEKRDPYQLFHKMPLGKLQELTPSFRWQDYLNETGIGQISQLNVEEPRFFQTLEGQIQAESLDVWKTYLRWHLVKRVAPYLSQAFVKAHFDFHRGYLRGVKELQPRWKRCIGFVDRDLGEALGQVFVEKTFPPAIKAQTLDMVQSIEKAMATRIKGLTWMTEPTKKQALAKLTLMRNKIGYPDKWRSYASLEIRPGDFFGNVERATLFESRRQLAKIGKPVDRSEWLMTPPTPNAYYNPAMNDMNFPAGVLLPPLYDPKLDAAPNYGNTGGTIGHELVHGFDDEGRKFNAQGNLKDWWTEKDAQEFEKRASCIADQYAQYVVVDDIKINSRLTLGEDVADLGGLILAWKAWKEATGKKPQAARDGLSPEQRFFVGFAQWDCENERDEEKRVSALTNPHSPGVYRINGVVVNMPEFAEAFACKADAPLVRKNVCQVW